MSPILELVSIRTWFTEITTISELFIESARECFVLEDKERLNAPKIFGVTAIPRGRYPILLTESPRFTKLLGVRTILPLIDLPPSSGFSGVRIHPGNKAADTEGCLLPGRTRAPDFVGESRAAFDALFGKLQAHVDAFPPGVAQMFITVRGP
jgi:hypothetical protein